MLHLSEAVILLTGADGGIGSALLHEFVARGARKIYAAGLSAKNLEPLAAQYPGIVTPLVLDVTDDFAIAQAVAQTQDVNLLVNNAGIELKSFFIGEQAAQKALFEMKVNYIGVISLINQYLPVLQQQAPAGIMNILSVGSTAVIKRLGTYCASKSATHLLTQSIRAELKEAGIGVTGVYPGYVDTAMSADITYEKASPTTLAQRICDAYEAGEEDIFPDRMSEEFYARQPITVTYLN
jgi:NADP-dependent 3-hydroxy acid dehydrogenase YdfG